MIATATVKSPAIPARTPPGAVSMSDPRFEDIVGWWP